MSHREMTGERPTDYSKWHRTLPDYCKAKDIDWIEYREKNGSVIPVAVIEVGRWRRTKFVGNQVTISKHIAEKLGIPLFFVEYTIKPNDYDKNVFKVINMQDGSERIMSNMEYSNFIEGL